MRVISAHNARRTRHLLPLWIRRPSICPHVPSLLQNPSTHPLNKTASISGKLGVLRVPTNHLRLTDFLRGCISKKNVIIESTANFTLRAERNPPSLTSSVACRRRRDYLPPSLPRNRRGTPRCTRTSLRLSIRLPLTNTARCSRSRSKSTRFSKYAATQGSRHNSLVFEPPSPLITTLGSVGWN